MKISHNAAIGALVLLAGPAAASTINPTAMFESTGVLSLSSAGFQAAGSLTAEYNAPPAGPRSYVFSSELSIGTVNVTPDITLTTPEITISAAREVCSFFGCITIPAVTLPSQTINVTPNIPLASFGTVFSGSFQSPELPVGNILSYDFGTPLLSTPLSFGELVQDQFETGATAVNVAGGVGPFGATFDYSGALQPGGNVILGNYALSLTEPGILGTIEAWALGLLNDNTEVLTDYAFDLFLASNPCAVYVGLVGTCNTLVGGLAPDSFGLVVNSLGTVTADYTLTKSITPSPIPLPAGLPLLMAGLGAIGLLRRRRARG
jgi:hypothetical protein